MPTLSIEEFIKKYGTRTPSLIIMELVTGIQLKESTQQLAEELARDLEAMLQNVEQ